MNATSPLAFALPLTACSFQYLMKALGIWQRYWFLFHSASLAFISTFCNFFVVKNLWIMQENLRQRKSIFEWISAVSSQSQLSPLVNKSTRVESSKKLSEICLRTLTDAERFHPPATSARIHKHVEFMDVTMSLSFNEHPTRNETDCENGTRVHLEGGERFLVFGSCKCFV